MSIEDTIPGHLVDDYYDARDTAHAAQAVVDALTTAAVDADVAVVSTGTHDQTAALIAELAEVAAHHSSPSHRAAAANAAADINRETIAGGFPEAGTSAYHVAVRQFLDDVIATARVTASTAGNRAESIRLTGRAPAHTHRRTPVHTGPTRIDPRDTMLLESVGLGVAR